MKHFKEIFGKVMIEITPVDIAMLGADVPVVTINGQNYADFVDWANKAFSPNLELGRAFFSDAAVLYTTLEGAFNEKSVATLKANGINEFNVTSEMECADDGCPLGCALWLTIPIIPDV
jgi:hypothetical protein